MLSSYTPPPESAFTARTPVRELATFGPVHLDVTDRARSIRFWRETVGLILRLDDEIAELGTANETLVKIYPVANAPFLQRHSGLYHLAIHPPTPGDFARILLRLIRTKWPISAVDHLGSKSIYLLDPDGITVEITLETPQRLARVDMIEGIPHLIDTLGVSRSGRDPLDIGDALSELPDDDSTLAIPRGTKIGHVHLYVGNLAESYSFYERLGFRRALYSGPMHLADFGAGGKFNHRLAMNTWQGENAPQSPVGTARMRRYEIRFDSDERLREAQENVTGVEETETGLLVTDPSGNLVNLSVGSPAS